MLFLVELRGEGLVRQHRRDARRTGFPQRRRPHRFGTKHERPGGLVAVHAQRTPGKKNGKLIIYSFLYNIDETGCVDHTRLHVCHLLLDARSFATWVERLQIGRITWGIC